MVFLSNTQNYDDFHPSIKHVFLDMMMSKSDKRKFQSSLVFLPIFIMKLFYKNYLKILGEIFQKEKITDQTIIFFEYLDNSMAYFLNEQKIISNYLNDTTWYSTIRVFI